MEICKKNVRIKTTEKLKRTYKSTSKSPDFVCLYYLRHVEMYLHKEFMSLLNKCKRVVVREVDMSKYFFRVLQVHFGRAKCIKRSKKSSYRTCHF